MSYSGNQKVNNSKIRKKMEDGSKSQRPKKFQTEMMAEKKQSKKQQKRIQTS